MGNLIFCLIFFGQIDDSLIDTIYKTRCVDLLKICNQFHLKGKWDQFEGTFKIFIGNDVFVLREDEINVEKGDTVFRCSPLIRYGSRVFCSEKCFNAIMDFCQGKINEERNFIQ